MQSPNVDRSSAPRKPYDVSGKNVSVKEAHGCGEQFCVGVNKIDHVPRNGLSVDLPNGVPKSNHIAA
jgi:hypothetical protein